MSEADAFKEFCENFDKSGKIKQKEWQDYYYAVSANIDSDDHFCMLMRNAWGLQE